FLALAYPYTVAAALALLCTEYDREPFERAEGERYYVSVGPRHLVQGAPTSPALANLVAWRLDRRLSGLAAKYGYTYTRYADDLTFSGDDMAALGRLRVRAQHIIAAEQFVVNAAKTRIAHRSSRQIVTGLVVNEKVTTPRRLRRQIRAILHNAQIGGLEAQNRAGRASFRAHIQGPIAFGHAAHPQHAVPLRQSLLQSAARESGSTEGRDT